MSKILKVVRARNFWTSTSSFMTKKSRPYCPSGECAGLLWLTLIVHHGTDRQTQGESGFSLEELLADRLYTNSPAHSAQLLQGLQQAP